MNTTPLNPILREIVDSLFLDDAGNANSIEVEGVIYNLEHPEAMTQEVFLKLQDLAERMGMDVARGQDCVDGFDARFEEVNRLLDAAPWTMHPDEGLVRKTNSPSSQA